MEQATLPIIGRLRLRLALLPLFAVCILAVTVLVAALLLAMVFRAASRSNQNNQSINLAPNGANREVFLLIPSALVADGDLK